MEESDRVRHNRDLDDTRDEALNPESEAMQTGSDNNDRVKATRNAGTYDEFGSKKAGPHGYSDRATVPLTNRKMEQDKKIRQEELERAEKEKWEKQQKKDERQKEWGE